jgi:hypothetical protein
MPLSPAVLIAGSQVLRRRSRIATVLFGRLVRVEAMRADGVFVPLAHGIAAAAVGPEAIICGWAPRGLALPATGPG